MAGKIFINYRRGEDAGFAQALFGRLEQAFRPEQLFMDVDSIEPGLDFSRVLNEQVAQCDVMISVIGKGWIDARDEVGNKRLDNPEDFVRIEIESALEQNKRVIPVLVGQAIMPRADQLPDTLKPLVARHAVRLTHERFRPDADGLINALQRALKAAKEARAKHVTSEEKRLWPRRARMGSLWPPARSLWATASLAGIVFFIAIGIWIVVPNQGPSHKMALAPPVQDIWTTSVYSYAPGGGGPGGGLADEYLKVGGYADLYYSLLQFSLSGLPQAATNVQLLLYNLDSNGGTPTDLYLFKITQSWNWTSQGTGRDRLRLWWADQPAAILYRSTPIPAPRVNSPFNIDITDLYNSWRSGSTPNYGIELRPVSNNNNFDVFGSSRNPKSALRPALVITASGNGRGL